MLRSCSVHNVAARMLWITSGNGAHIPGLVGDGKRIVMGKCGTSTFLKGTATAPPEKKKAYSVVSAATKVKKEDTVVLRICFDPKWGKHNSKFPKAATARHLTTLAPEDAMAVEQTFGWNDEKEVDRVLVVGLVRVKKRNAGKLTTYSGEQGVFLQPTRWQEDFDVHAEVMWIDLITGESDAEYLIRSLDVAAKNGARWGLYRGAKQLGYKEEVNPDSMVVRKWQVNKVPRKWGESEVRSIIMQQTNLEDVVFDGEQLRWPFRTWWVKAKAPAGQEMQPMDAVDDETEELHELWIFQTKPRTINRMTRPIASSAYNQVVGKYVK